MDGGEGNCGCGDKVVEMVELFGIGDICLGDGIGVGRTEKCGRERVGLEGEGDGRDSTCVNIVPA